MKSTSKICILAMLWAMLPLASAWSQAPCVSDIKHNQLYQNNRSYRAAVNNFEQLATTFGAGSQERVDQTYTIPVVVHIIHTGEPYGQGSNITDEQVYSAITAMNNDFRKVVGTFGFGAGVDVNMEFCLASRNPSGQPTSGINRVNGSSVANYATQGINGSSATGASEAAVKALSTWPRTSYVNIWVVSEIDNNDGGAGTQGYAYFPFNSPLDGIVILYNAFGTVGNLKSYTNRNRTLTHEMGHVFSLYHTFNETTACGAESDCANQGDRVCDTPPTVLQASCSTPACSGTQQVANYMDYTSETCQNMFSNGQRARMRTSLLTNRASLTTSTGCMPVFTTDAGIAAVLSPSGTSCATSYTPSVTLMNFGSTAITSCVINYNVDGVGLQTFTWTGNLAANTGTTVTLPAITTTLGDHTLYVWNGNINGLADQNAANNQSTGTFTVASGTTLTLTVNLDLYGSENTWQVIDANNAVMDFGGPYQDGTQGTVITESICLPAGCYTLRFMDSFGDGQSFTSGSYTLRNGTTVLASATGNWGPLSTTNFCVTASSGGGAAPVANFNVADNAFCVGGTASFTNTSTNSPTTYAWSFPGGTPSSSASANPGTITYSSAGTYNVTLTVTNSNGTNTYMCPSCITVLTGPTIAFSTVNPFCNGSSNGSVVSTLTGGYTPYTYAWSSGETTANISNKAAGSYTLTATNNQGCVSTATATLTNPAAMVITGAVTQPSCNGANNGSIAVSVTGGTGTKSYSWNTGATTAPISSLAPGTYTCNVTDANFCTASQSFTITNPTAVSISGSATQPLCSTGTGSITVTTAGGTGTRTVTWNTGATGTSLSGLTAGTYTATVRDANNCTASQAFTITAPSAITITGTTTAPSCSGGNTGGISVSATGGTGTKTFSWSNGSTGATVNNLAAGNYTVTATDANGCTATQSFTLAAPGGITLSGTTTAPLCNGSANGAIAVTATGGTGNRTYAWSNGATTASISNLSAGSYTVTVTDAAGCSATQTFSLTNPAALTINGTVTAPLCATQANGSINVTTAGGTGTRTVSWNTGATGNTLNSLGAGAYTATVTDANGCTAMQSFTVTAPALLTISTIVNQVSCNGGNNGSIATTLSGGTGNKTYAWSNGATSASLINLGAGTYTLSATDANGCVATHTATINAPSAITISGTASAPSCNGDNNGSITVSASGGTANKTFVWNNGTQGATLNNAVAGTYTVSATDANGCMASQTFTITQPSAINLQVNSFNGSCGATTGSAQATTSGGSGSITVQWSNGATGAAVSNLIPGAYSVLAIDANGCSASANFQIEQSSGLSVVINKSDITCFGLSNGSATAMISGGVDPYTYSWNTGATATAINGLTAGTYSVSVTDANGCSGNAVTTILSPSAVQVSASKSDVTCFGANDGFAVANAFGGTGTLQYNWSTGATGNTLNGVGEGFYTVTVSDANGCANAASVSIIEPSMLTANVIVIAPESCAGNDGAVDVIVDGGSPDYMLIWSNGFEGSTASNLSAGTYLVSIADMNGCALNAEVIIPFDCTVEVPSTRLVDADCGAVDIALTDILTCNEVAGADQYQWRFANIAGQVLGDVITNGPQAFVSQIPGVQTGWVIQVSVKVQVAGNWGNFGEVCTIGIPNPAPSTTQLNTASCGATLTSWNSSVVADALEGAVMYIWRFTANGNAWTSNTVANQIFIGSNTPLVPGTTYSVQVRVQLSDGSLSDWGSACDVTLDAALTISEGDNEDTSFAVWPNPNNGENIVVHFGNSIATAPVQQLEIFAINGSLVEKNNSLNPANGTLNYTFNHSLAQGMYVIRIIQNNIPREEKFIVK